jgi:hypothetical protein
MLGLAQRVLLAVVALAAMPPSLHAQTDWYNTDRGRPLRTTDALVMERHAFEFHLAPLTFSRTGGVSRWEAEPELGWGILPRTQFEVGLPLASDASLGGDANVAARGVHVALLHALNAETLLIPGLAVGVDAIFPAGGRRAEHTHGSVIVAATRTARLGRAHLNFTQHIGPQDDVRADVPRWRAGLALDRPIPLRTMLVGAEVYAEEPLAGGPLRWTAGAGLRWQLAPRLAFDAGVARIATGPERGWAFTFGHAIEFGLPFLQPTGGF